MKDTILGHLASDFHDYLRVALRHFALLVVKIQPDALLVVLILEPKMELSI